MNQLNASKAYAVISRLCGFKLPVHKAHGLYKLAKALEGHYQFSIEEEKKYIDEFGGKVLEDGTISFETPEKLESFRERLVKLHEMTVNIDVTPVVLTESDLADQTITASEIFSLEGLVAFE